jgi:predicted transcriptional regulator
MQRTTYTGVYLDPEVHRDLRLLAAWEQRTLKDIVHQALRQWIDQHLPAHLKGQGGES